MKFRLLFFSFSMLLCTVAMAGNYRVANANNNGYSSLRSISVAPKEVVPLTHDIQVESKTYDGNTTVTFTGGIIIDDPNIAVHEGFTLEFEDAGAGKGKKIVAKNYVLTGESDTDYELPELNLTADINPVELMVEAVVANKYYDGNTDGTLMSIRLLGLLGTERLNVSADVEFNSKNAAEVTGAVVKNFELTDGENGGLASNYTTKDAEVEDTNARIFAKHITVKAQANDKIYNGNTSGTLKNYEFEGLIGDETLHLTADVYFSNKNVVTDLYASIINFNLLDGENGGLASNYNLTTTRYDDTTAKITKANIIVKATDQTMVYGGTYSTTKYTADSSTPLAPADRLTGNLTASGTLSPSGNFVVGIEHAIEAGTISVNDGNNGGNYNITFVNGILTVEPLELQHSIAAASKVYNGSVAAVVTGRLTNVFRGDDVDVNVSLEFETPDVGTDKKVIATVWEKTGADAANYSLPPFEGVGAIYKGSVALKLNDDIQYYTGSAINISPAEIVGIAADNELNILYAYTDVNGNSVSKVINAGTYLATARTSGNTNYSGATSNTAMLRVEKATPVITVSDVASAYTGRPVTIGTPVISGGTAARDLSFVIYYEGIDDTDYEKSESAPRAVGVYQATITTEGDNNHNAAGATAKIYIGQNAPVITLNDASKVYDGKPFNVSATVEPSHLTLTYSYRGTLKNGTAYEETAQAPADAGDYIVTASTPGSGDYIPFSTTARLEITKSNVSISITNVSTAYTGSPVVVEAAKTIPENLNLTLTYSSVDYPESNMAPSGIGEYQIKAVFSGNNNYTSASASGSLAIVGGTVPTLSLADKTAVYTGQPHAIDPVVITPSTAAQLAVTYYYANDVYNSSTPPTNAGTYKVTATTAAGGIYQTNSVSATLTVGKAEQIIIFPEIAEKSFGEEPFNLGVTTNSGLAITYASSNTAVAEVAADGTVTIKTTGQTTITASNGGNENYNAVSQSRVLRVVSGDVNLYKLTVNGVEHNIDEIYEMLCDDAGTLNIAVETAQGSVVDRGNPFTVTITEPGVSAIEFTISSPDGSKSQEYILTVEKQHSFEDLITLRWDNTLTVINDPAKNGGYNFLSYQWYRKSATGAEFELIAQGQYYSAGYKGESLNSTDLYYVEVTTTDGQTFRTCAGTPGFLGMNVKAYPNPVARNSTIYIEADVEPETLQNSYINIYNMAGIRVKTVKTQGRLTPVVMSNTPGTYFIKFEGEAITGREMKVIVK